MKKYKVVRKMTQIASYEVEAKNLQEARDKAQDEDVITFDDAFETFKIKCLGKSD